jgi:hypothetical protein
VRTLGVLCVLAILGVCSALLYKFFAAMQHIFMEFGQIGATMRIAGPNRSPPILPISHNPLANRRNSVSVQRIISELPNCDLTPRIQPEQFIEFKVCLQWLFIPRAGGVAFGCAFAHPAVSCSVAIVAGCHHGGWLRWVHGFHQRQAGGIAASAGQTGT